MWSFILSLMDDVTTEIRAACARVAAEARSVAIVGDALPAYAASLPAPHPDDPEEASGRDPEEQAAFWLTLDAINFGSGWFPTLRKPPGMSGYQAVAAGVRRRFAARGAWSARELRQLDGAAIASVLRQDPHHELMALFAETLRDLGAHIDAEYGGRFLGPVEAARGSAVALVAMLAAWSSFRDSSGYDGFRVPFLKRAQITAADLARSGPADFADLGRLTMFADNLVPHVLRLDGVLRFSDQLVAQIEREELLEHGSPDEVEIRACAVHAVELIVAERSDLRSADVDQVLRNRGRGPRYKARPRHRSRCTAY
jgi:hypothetical protein